MNKRSVGRDGPERLGAVPLFSELTVGERRMLADILDEFTAEAGELLMAQDQQGFELLVIEQGTVEIHQDGRVINEMGPGDFLGEMSVLDDGAPRSASAIAASEVRGLVLTAHFVREVHQRLPKVGQRMDEAVGAHRASDRERRGPTSA